MEDAIRVPQQLAKKGKTPSVGLVKAKLAKGYPLPKIIAALRVWQDHPDLTTAEPADKTAPAITTEVIDDELDARIQRHIASAVHLLQQDIAELRAEINRLKANN